MVKHLLLFGHNLSQIMLWGHLMFFQTIDDHSFHVVSQERVPFEPSTVAEEFIPLLRRQKRNYFVDIFILVVPVAFHELIEVHDHPVQITVLLDHECSLLLELRGPDEGQFRDELGSSQGILLKDLLPEIELELGLYHLRCHLEFLIVELQHLKLGQHVIFVIDESYGVLNTGAAVVDM